MLLLGIETATAHTSVVLAEDGRELSAWREVTHQDLCRRLAAEIGRVMAEAGRTLADIELVVAGLGPGSFTSMRVGLATAKGIALARGIPLVGVSSLEAMAWRARAQFPGLVCPVIDARRGELYGAIYRAGPSAVERVGEEFVASPEGMAERLHAAGERVVVFGEVERLAESDRAHLGETFQPEPVYPEAAALIELGLRRYRERGGDDIGPLRPIYVRMSYAEEERDLDLGLR